MAASAVRDTRLLDKVCVVTGAASGIGRGIATVFAEHGACLALLDLQPLDGTLEAIRESFAEKGLAFVEDRILRVRCDITCEAELRRSMEVIAARWGRRITAVVNNAARFVFRDVLTATGHDWDATLSANIKGHALVLRYAVPHMAHDGTGAIVNISSISSFIAQPNMVTYAVTKAAILQMTRNTSLDLWSRYKIRCNAVCPGAILTPATHAHYAGEKQKNPDKELTFEDFVKGMNGAIIDRLGTTREVGCAALFLASEESSFCTGTALMVDGGWSTNPTL
eukprot:TRINITY_DN5527_c1_g1_i1.p1 TRINITY_DN5527_c1_g1~~TRINITY_DN5527_c1_g1_i1.p1  ORF type:complete len:307 (+),score=93.70 TRINITY_DN5527_c1_g1_i1:80-922(+)